VPTANGAQSGDVSLVVPVQDEADSIVALLKSIAAQTQLPRELVLVDAGSRDATAALAAAASLPIPMRIVSAERVYPGEARNRGVAEARHRWIAFTDAGIVLDRSWLEQLIRHAQVDVDLVFGNYDPVCDTLYRECAALAYVPARNDTGTRGPFIASCLMRKDLLLRAGGFPPYRAAEDLILFARLRELAARPAFAPAAVVRWQIAGDFGATFNRFECYSYHNLRAGWGRHWHIGTARLYLGLATLLALAAAIAQAAWSGPIVLCFFLGRAAKAAYGKRLSFDFTTLTPQRVIGAAAILAIIDTATLVGFTRWLTERLRR
jgi:glycosyltransferase involved in cell wall biosynthesis